MLHFINAIDLSYIMLLCCSFSLNLINKQNVYITSFDITYGVIVILILKFYGSNIISYIESNNHNGMIHKLTTKISTIIIDNNSRLSLCKMILIQIIMYIRSIIIFQLSNNMKTVDPMIWHKYLRSMAHKLHDTQYLFSIRCHWKEFVKCKSSTMYQHWLSLMCKIIIGGYLKWSGHLQTMCMRKCILVAVIILFMTFMSIWIMAKKTLLNDKYENEWYKSRYHDRLSCIDIDHHIKLDYIFYNISYKSHIEYIQQLMKIIFTSISTFLILHKSSFNSMVIFVFNWIIIDISYIALNMITFGKNLFIYDLFMNIDDSYNNIIIKPTFAITIEEAILLQNPEWVQQDLHHLTITYPIINKAVMSSYLHNRYLPHNILDSVINEEYKK